MKETKLSIVISEDTLQLISDYLNEIKQNPTIMGQRLRKVFENTNDIEQLTTADLINALLKTKKPQIFPEHLKSGLLGNGRDWTKQEAQLLGRIGLKIEVQAYSKQTYNPTLEDKLQSPHPVTVLVTNGALLKGNETGECKDGCDQEEVCENGSLNKEKLKKYFEARLLPLLLQANQDAGNQGGLVTIPGLGAGAFAGGKKFSDGQAITSQLGNIYREIIAENKDKLKNIKGIIYDKFDPPVSEPIVISGSNIKFIEEACSNDKGKQRIGSGQLALPEEHDKAFKGCKLYTVIAGDHVAFPGNDMYLNSCHTHEGGIGARTNLLGVITGIEGEYIEQEAKFLPKEDPTKTWNYYCKTNEACLGVETVTIAGKNGTIKKEQYQHSNGYNPAYLDAYKTTYDNIPVPTAFTDAITATPIAAAVVENTEAQRKQEKEKTRQQLGFNNQTNKYESNKKQKQEQYKQKIQQHCHFSVNFGLNYEGGEKATNPPEIKNYPLWKVMKKIETDAPESTTEQKKQKHIAIASIRALIYLKLHKQYAAELAYLYSIEREFIQMKDSVFHQFRLDANNPENVSHLEKDLLIWRTPAYNPLNNYGIHPNLANHLEYYLRFNNYQDGEPWTKKEVLAKLEEDLVAQETLISTIIDPTLTPQKQDDLLKNFVSKVQTGHTGCAAERLQGALTSLAEGKFSVSKKIDKLLTEDNFKELNNYLAQIDEDANQYDPKKIADIYMNLFIQLDGQKILFETNGQEEEIEVSPNNYQSIINKMRSYLIDVAYIIDEDTAKNFYELPDGFWLFNSQNIPNFIAPKHGSNIGYLEFDDQKTAERSLVFLKHFFATHTDDKVFTNHAKIQNKEGKFVISISEVQYTTFFSYKDSLTTAMQKAGLKHQDPVAPKSAPAIAVPMSISAPTPVPATTPTPLSIPVPAVPVSAVPAPVSAKVNNKTKLENFASKILAIDSEDPSYKCILVNIKESDSILVVNPDNPISLSLFNQTLFDRLSAEKKGSDEIILQLKDVEKSSINFSEYISQKNNQYSLNIHTPGKYRKGIQYLCDQLNGDLPPPSLDLMIQNYFFPTDKRKPNPNNQYFNQNIGMIIGQLAHQNEQTVKDPLSNIPIKPIQHHGQIISGANILAIYLQACRNAGIDLFNEPSNLAYLDELLEEIPDSNAKASAKQKYLAQFEELSTGDHLNDFISGKLQLSEPEKAFLAHIDIIPSPTKLATPPITNPLAKTFIPLMHVPTAQTPTNFGLLEDNQPIIPQLANTASDKKPTFPSGLQLNRVNEYYVPFQLADPNDPKKSINISAQDYADRLIEHLKLLLASNPDLKLAITYSANNKESHGIYQSYDETVDYQQLQSHGLEINGGGQAPAFALLQQAIFRDPDLRSRVHILPVTTVLHSATDIPHAELVKRDLENIATHLGAGFMVLGLTNQQTLPKKRFAIGGANAAADWFSGLGQDVNHILNQLKEGYIHDVSFTSNGRGYALKQAYDRGKFKAQSNEVDDRLSQLIENLNFDNPDDFNIMALYTIENFFVLSTNKEKHLQNLYKKINRNIIKNIINSTDENAEDILRILVRLSGTSQKDEVYLLLHRMLFNNEFDGTQKATIANWFPGIVDSNTEQFEIIKVPDDTQELRSLQVRYITNLLSRAIIPNIPADGFNEYIQIPNSKTIVRCSGDIVVAPNLAAKHIASNFWKALFDYFNDNKKFPDKIRIINRVNFGNNHWTSVITEIELDPAKIQKILDALEIAKQDCIQQNSNLSADKLEQIYNFLNGSPVDPCVLPTKDIQIRHYDSMNPHGGTSATHDSLTESLAKLQEDNQDAKFNLTAKPCIQQTGLQCGDWTALNGFVAGILEQDPAKIDPKKIGNLRSISKRCIDLEQRIQRGEPITQEQIEEVFSVINQSLPKFSSPLTTQLPQNTAIQQQGSSKVVPDTASKLTRLSKDFCDLEDKFQSEKQHDSLSEIKLPEPINNQQLQEHFEDFDLTKHGLKYQSKTTSDFKKTGILGEIITTRQINNNDQVIPADTTLAAFRPSSVECKIMQNSTNNNGKVLLGEQQQILLDFLQLYSKQAIQEKSSSPIVIEADNFNPEDLQVLLETLINKPIPLISLALPPKPKNVNQQPYTAQDINKINQLITQYHAKQSASFPPKKPSKKLH